MATMCGATAVLIKGILNKDIEMDTESGQMHGKIIHLKATICSIKSMAMESKHGEMDTALREII